MTIYTIRVDAGILFEVRAETADAALALVRAARASLEDGVGCPSYVLEEIHGFSAVRAYPNDDAEPTIEDEEEETGLPCGQTTLTRPDSCCGPHPPRG